MSEQTITLKSPHEGHEFPQNQDAEQASFFVHEVMADTMGLGSEELESSRRRAQRVMGLMGMIGFNQ